MADKERARVWKHIGLYGHAVGTFAADPTGITWKSAAGNYDAGDVETRRSLPKSSISGALWTVFGKSGHLRVLTKGGDNAAAASKDGAPKLPSAMRFDGFPPSDYDALSEAFSSLYGVTCKRHPMSAAGGSWGNTDISNKHLVFRQCRLDKNEGDEGEEEGEEFEPRDGDEMLSLDLAEVSQCVLPGNNRNEIEMQFLESDTVEAGTDQLVAIRFYVPPDADADPTDREAPTSAEVLQSHIMNVASVKRTSGAVIAEFDEGKGTFLTPRGRYAIELYDAFLRMRGAKYDYKIRYDDISRLFLLPRQDDMHMAFVIALDKPIRQGQQRYNMLVMQCTKEHSELEINLDDATLQKEYNGDIQSHMDGSFSNLVAKTFKVITRKKVFIPGKFANANQQACVKCALRANEGHLYPLEKQFIFIHKPAVLIRFDEIESVEFQRYAGGQGSTRNFDLSVTLHSTPGDSVATREYTFSGIDKTNYAALYSFLSGKKIRIANHEGAGADDQQGPGIDASDRGGEEMEDDGEESSEDEDYDQEGGSDGSGGGSDDDDDEDEDDDEDDDDLGSVASDDSDLKQHRKAAAKKKEGGGKSPTKKRKESSSSASPPAKKKAVVAKKKTKKKKDPNAPKSAKSAFMFFSGAKRSEIKEAHPEASFGEMGKLVGAAWKELSDGDKAEWEEKAKQDKVRYKKEMDDYSAPSDDDDSDEDSGDDDSDDAKAKKKPKAKRAKKDPNAPKQPMNSYMLYSNSVRAKIREENPGFSVGDVAKEIASRYKTISAEEKARWQSKADAAKEVYKKEMARYNLTKPVAVVKKKPDAKPEGKKKKPAPTPESSEESDESESESDDSDDSDDSDSE
jgi:structure-specific recognition protein 1